MSLIPNMPLSTGPSSIEIPALGFGVFQVPDAQTPAAVMTALDVGYRSLDTARIYGNEEGVGRALAQTDVAREDIFLTTKVWNDDQGYDPTLHAFEASAKRLGTDIDLYLIHWPVPAKDMFVDTWKALLQLRADGRIRAAGVCNFQQAHLERLIAETGEAPAINQIELHPYLQQSSLRAFHAARQCRDSQVGDPLPDRRELRHLRVRARGAGHRGDRAAQHRQSHRTRPRRLQRRRLTGHKSQLAVGTGSPLSISAHAARPGFDAPLRA